MKADIADKQLQDALEDVVRMWRRKYSIQKHSGWELTAESADRGKYTAVIRQYISNDALCLWLSFSRQGPRPGLKEPISTYAIDFHVDEKNSYVFDLAKLQDRNRRVELYRLACDFVSEC